jgi:integrase
LSADTVRVKFTKRTIQSLPTPKTKRATYYDSTEKGLGVQVQTSGARSFFLYKKVRGRNEWLTLGTFPEFSVEQAITKAKELNAACARWKENHYKGISPIELDRLGRSANDDSPTLRDALDSYIEGRIRLKAKNPAHAEKFIRWQFNKYAAALAERTLESLTREDMRKLHAKLSSQPGKKPGVTKGKFTANRVIELLRAIFNWARKTDMLTGENPADVVEKNPEPSRARFLRKEEMPRFFKALEAEKNLDLSDFVWLALFSGIRSGNIFSLEWRNVDLESATIFIADPKSRNPYYAPIVPEVDEILRARRGRLLKDCNFVFPSNSASGHVVDMKRAWAKLIARAGIEDLNPHDLRRTYATMQLEANTTLAIVGKSLGHSSTVSTEVYARTQIESVRQSALAAAAIMMAASKKQKMLAAGKS